MKLFNQIFLSKEKLPGNTPGCAIPERVTDGKVWMAIIPVSCTENLYPRPAGNVEGIFYDIEP